MLFKSLAIAAAVGTAIAQRPSNTSICDYYTTALLTNNTAANQLSLLTLIVNTAVIGNYTTPNVGVAVPGILAAGEYNGTAVNLLPYFNGGYASSPGGDVGMSVNYLDGGGADPLKQSKPANDMTSNQYILLTHLYEYFGTLLNCSQQGSSAYPAYSGDNSMYDVHKFMDLTAAENNYFIEQVALSAASFGVAASDLQTVGTALNSLFGYRCSPEVTVTGGQPELQAICIADSCPTSPNATCSAYAAAVMPSVAVSSLVPTTTASVTGSMTGTAAASSAASSRASSASRAATSTGSSASATGTGAASNMAGEMSLAAMAAGLFAFLL